MRRSHGRDPGFLILVSLSAGERYGYAMMEDIEAFAGVRLGPGTLYGALERLERDGLVEPIDSDDRRRPYRLTDAGAASLRRQLSDVRAVADVARRRLASR